MNEMTFDTLAAAKALREAGFEERQAESPAFERVRKSNELLPWVRRRLAGMRAERATKMPARRRRTQEKQRLQPSWILADMASCRLASIGAAPVSIDFLTRSFAGAGVAEAVRNGREGLATKAGRDTVATKN